MTDKVSETTDVKELHVSDFLRLLVEELSDTEAHESPLESINQSVRLLVEKHQRIVASMQRLVGLAELVDIKPNNKFEAHRAEDPAEKLSQARIGSFSLETAAGRDTRLGLIVGNWAAHPIVNSNSWTVTYIPTGLNITSALKTCSPVRAVALVCELSKYLPRFKQHAYPNNVEISRFWEIVKLPSTLDIFDYGD